MSWLFKSKDSEALRRDARAPAIAKHGSIVSNGDFHKRGREYATWTKRRFDIHDDSTLVYYDGNVYKGEIDLHEVTITFGSDSTNSVISAKGSSSTGTEICLDLYCPHGSPEVVAPRRSVFRSNVSKTAIDRTLHIIMNSPQEAAILCSTIATLDLDGLGNAQDFAAVQGWMMPRRVHTHVLNRAESNESNVGTEIETEDDVMDRSPDIKEGSIDITDERVGRVGDDTSSLPLPKGDQSSGHSHDDGKGNDDGIGNGNGNKTATENVPVQSTSVLLNLFPSVDLVESVEEETKSNEGLNVTSITAEHVNTHDVSADVDLATHVEELAKEEMVEVPRATEHDETSTRPAKRRNSSLLSKMWDTVLPAEASNVSKGERVHGHGLLYVLAETEKGALTDRNALIAAQTELEWQPRMFEVNNVGMLRIQGSTNTRGNFLACEAASICINMQQSGCSQISCKHSTQNNRNARYAGSSAHIFLDALDNRESNASNNGRPVFTTEELKAFANLEKETDEGLRNRKTSNNWVAGAGGSGDRNDSTSAKPSLDSASLGAVRFADVKTTPLPDPLVQGRPPTDIAATIAVEGSVGGSDNAAAEAASAARHKSFLPENRHDPKQRLFQTPILRLTLSRGEDVLITFLPADLQYADVLCDDRFNLSYALHLQIQLQALDEALAFMTSLQTATVAVDAFETAASMAHAIENLQEQRHIAEAEQRRYTIVFNGSATKSASNVYVFLWCVCLLLTVLRPSSMTLFMFAIVTYLFISVQKWLNSEDGDRVFASMQTRMRDLRISRGDTVILLEK